MDACKKDYEFYSYKSDTSSSEGKHLICVLYFQNTDKVNGVALPCAQEFYYQYSAYLWLSTSIFVVPNVANFYIFYITYRKV